MGLETVPASWGDLQYTQAEGKYAVHYFLLLSKNIKLSMAYMFQNLFRSAHITNQNIYMIRSRAAQIPSC